MKVLIPFSSQTLIFEAEQYWQSLIFWFVFVTGAFLDGCYICLLNADPTKED